MAPDFLLLTRVKELHPPQQDDGFVVQLVKALEGKISFFFSKF